MKKTYWIVGVTVLVLAVGGYLIFDNRSGKTDQNNGQEQGQGQQTKNDSNKPAGTYWSGQLRDSDDKTRGNLMLYMPQEEQTIYIRTARDYSGLIGKDVYVTYEGDITKFKMLDMVAQ